MVVSYPVVNNNGELTGAEVTLRFSDIKAINHMSKWVRMPRTLEQQLNLNHEDEDHYQLVPGCVTIVTLGNDFQVKADYDTLKAQMIDLNEWDVTE